MTLVESSQRAFVFIACGVAEHVQTLHVALSALQRCTDFPIYVITDSTRNEIRIEWQQIIDVRTPSQFDHHQASIFLKTSIHRHLPHGVSYCYLDTDVLALGREVNEVFDHKSGPVTFAADHCQFQEFSPYALHCGCIEFHQEERQLMNALQKVYDENSLREAEARELELRLLMPKPKPKRTLKSSLRSVYSRLFLRSLKPSDQLFHVIEEQEDPYIKYIEENSGLRWDKKSNGWLNSRGEIMYPLHCTHLIDAVYSKFGVRITDSFWQHWNGGVFLFCEESHSFLDQWHSMTMEIFAHPYWRTRDQGTLIALIWKLGLQHQEMLPRRFNLLVDFHKNNITIDKSLCIITEHGQVSVCEPSLIHVQNHFGDESWFLWNWVKERIEAQTYS